MTLPTDPYLLRATTMADFDPAMSVLFDAFGMSGVDDQIDAERMVYEPARGTVVERDGVIVANAGAYTRELTVPGAVVPAAHVTLVAVAATHRRRGLLTRLMGHQLRAVPEAVAVLWASEGKIYQRFGYGLAARSARLTVPTNEVTPRPSDPAGVEVRAKLPAEASEELRQVYERVRAKRPGWSGRDERWWGYVLADPPSKREVYGPKRVVLAHGPDGPDGYAVWRVSSSWSAGGPDGTVQVLELVAATPAAYLALWRFLLTVDLMRTVEVSMAAVDEPLLLAVDEPRRLDMRVIDGLWLRLVDLPAALSARRYAAPVETVIEVTDQLLPGNAGRWRLRAGPDGLATCTATTDEPELRCDVAALGAAYLGATPLAQLALAGRVHEVRPGALADASTAFGWPVTAYPIEVF